MTGWCSTYDRACTSPVKNTDGASSYRQKAAVPGQDQQLTVEMHDTITFTSLRDHNIVQLLSLSEWERCEFTEGVVISPINHLNSYTLVIPELYASWLSVIYLASSIGRDCFNGIKLMLKINTPAPTDVPTFEPSIAPTRVPTLLPTSHPTLIPTFSPSTQPTATQTFAPTTSPTKGVSAALLLFVLLCYGLLAYTARLDHHKGADIFSGHGGIWHLHHACLARYQTLIVTLGDISESGNAKNRVNLAPSICARCGVLHIARVLCMHAYISEVPH